MKIVIENIRSQLVTRDTKLLSLLFEKYSCYQPGYQYSPQYKRHVWDGKVRFFASTGTFSTGLLQSIIDDLTKVGAEFELEDNRDFESTDIQTYQLEDGSLRDYQDDLFADAMRARRGLLKAPTGAGKTYLMAAMISAMRENFGLIIFNKTQLLHQTYETFKELGLDVGAYYGGFKELKPITCVSKGSLDTIYDSFVDHAKFIIFDEIHEIAAGKKANKIFHAFPHATHRFGFTATVPKDKFLNLSLVSAFGNVIERVSTQELIKSGKLAKPDIFMINVEHVFDDALSYRQEYSVNIVNSDQRNGVIKDLAEKIKGRTLIVVQELAHQENLKKLLPDAYILNGSDSIPDRNKSIDKFKGKKEAIIIGTNIMQTGISIDEITHVINARGLKSDIATIQLLGRGLRVHEGKTRVTVYDFFDNNTAYLGKHSKNRMSAYKSEGHEVIILK